MAIRALIAHDDKGVEHIVLVDDIKTIDFVPEVIAVEAKPAVPAQKAFPGDPAKGYPPTPAVPAQKAVAAVDPVPAKCVLNLKSGGSFMVTSTMQRMVDMLNHV